MMMDFAGGPFVLDIQRPITLEHLQRYALCRDAVRGKRVLDLACGEGYGSAMLSDTAARVVGVDPDPGLVAHAAATYGRLPHLGYAIGSGDRLPVSDRSMDVVIAFDALAHHHDQQDLHDRRDPHDRQDRGDQHDPHERHEHERHERQDQHDEMLREIRRVLVPGGLLLLFSPNALADADFPDHQPHVQPQAQPEAHEGALSFDDLDTLLKSVFEQVEFWGQRPGVGSFVYPLNHAAARATLRPLTLEDGVIAECVAPLAHPAWFLAACSDAPFEPQALRFESVAAEPADDVYALLTRTVRGHERSHRQREAAITQLTDRLDAARTAQKTATRLHSVAVAELQDLRQEQREHDRVLTAVRHKLETTVEALDDARRTAEAARLQAQVAQEEFAAAQARAAADAAALDRQHAAAQAAWQQERDTLTREHDALVDNLRLELSSVYDSKSWRLTAPIRATRRTIDGLRRAVGGQKPRGQP